MPYLRDTEEVRCANCGLRCYTGIRSKNKAGSTHNKRAGGWKGVQAVSGLSPAEHSLLSTWLQPYGVPDLESRLLCGECAAYIRAHADEAAPAHEPAPEPAPAHEPAPAPAPAPPRWLGHDEVCATCGVSVKTARHVQLDEQKHPFHAMLQPYIQHYKEGAVKICLSCSQKIGRLYEAANKPLEIEVVFNQETIKKPNIEEQESVEGADVESANTKEFGDKNNKLTLKSYWKLELPRRLACIACGGPEVGRVRLGARQQLMLRHKLYVPSGARVCAEHAAAGDTCAEWPAPSDDPQREFSPEEIADMLFLLKLIYPADLGDVKSLAPYTRKKWLGVTLERFEEILTKTPKLLEDESGRFALAVYLASRNSGECVTVLASVCQRPRELVQSAVELARECVDMHI